MYFARFLFSLLGIALLIWGITGCSSSSNQSFNTPTSIDSLIYANILISDIESETNRNHEKALNRLMSILILPNVNEALDSSRGNLYHRIGSIYLRIEDFQQAFNYFDTAIIIQQFKTSKKEQIALANSYFNRSLALQYQLNFNDAIKDIHHAIKIIEAFPALQQIKGNYYAYAGYYYFSIVEYDRALTFYEQAIPITENNSHFEAELRSNYGKYFEHFGQYQKAIDQYDIAIDIYSNLPNAAFYSSPIEFNRFDLLTETLPYEDAQSKYHNFLTHFQDTSKNLKHHKWNGHNNLAFLNIDNGDFDLAHDNYSKALALSEELNPSKYSVLRGCSYEGLGDVQYGKKNYLEAIKLYHQAIQALSIGFDSNNIFELPDPKKHIILNRHELERIIGFKADAIVDKYRSTNSLSDLKAAFFTYQQLDQLLVQIRQGYKAALSRFDLIDRTIPTYEKATFIAWALYKRTGQKIYADAAYQFASKNKAVVMLDGLQDEKARFSGIPAKVLALERQLKKEIYTLEGAIFDLNQSDDPSPLKIKNLVNERFNKTRSYEDLIDQLETTYPKYYQLKYASNASLDSEKIRQSLPDSTAVIEYFVGEDSIYIFSFSQKKTLACEVIEKTEAYTSFCKALRNMTERDSLFSMTSFSEAAHGLYNLLLSNSLEKINSAGQTNRLIIISDDLLTQFSFETLLSAPIDSVQQKDWTTTLPYLIQDYAISYSYSNQLLFKDQINERLTTAKTAYIGFGLEYDDYTLKAIGKLQEIEEVPRMNRGMGKLLYSDDEVLESAKILGGKSFVNAAATKQNFIKEAPNASILHLVTHGYISKNNPLNSGLIFTKQHENDDFILKASDIYTLELKAEMAALSACNTGDGKIEKGEGIRSLARAFNFAGCPNVTASLWAAPDLSTKEIMVAYYQGIKAGNPKDISLRTAKLKYINHCKFNIEALPCNWAHLVSIGKQ